MRSRTLPLYRRVVLVVEMTALLAPLLISIFYSKQQFPTPRTSYPEFLSVI